MDCNGCSPQTAIDGGTIGITSDTEVRVMSQIDGIFHEMLAVEGDPVSIAISGSGIAVGYNGHVDTYKRSVVTGVWLQSDNPLKVDLPDGHGFKVFGRSVALDGDILVVGAPRTKDTAVEGAGYDGAAYIYKWTQNAWMQVKEVYHPKQEGEGIAYYWRLGQKVAIKGDLIAIADPSFGNNEFEDLIGRKSEHGAVVIYSSYQSSTYYTSRLRLGDECAQWFGEGIALTDDGDLLVWCKDPSSVYLYTQSDKPGVYNETPERIQASDEQPSDGFGRSIAIDGNIMAIGTYKVTSGKVYLFTLADGTWKEFLTIEAPLGSRYFGQSVSLSGRTVIVSSSHNAYSYTLRECT